MDNLNLQENQIIQLMLRGHTTNSIGDSMVQSRVLAMYKGKPEYEEVKKLIVAIRENWNGWRFNCQREWSDKRHHPKHHDSFEIRQGYIAPHENNYELEHEFKIKARSYAKTIHPELFTGLNNY